MNRHYLPVDITELEISQMEQPVELTLTPFLFDEKDEFNSADHLLLLMWAFDKQSKINCCKVINNNVTCCIELTEDVYQQFIPDGGKITDAQYFIDNDENIIWDEDEADKLFLSICYKLRSKGLTEPVDYYFSYYTDIYYYTGKTKPYMYLYFKTIKDKNNFKRICAKYKYFYNRSKYSKYYIDLIVHEEKVSTTMRLMAKSKLRYDAWFTVKAVKVNKKSEYCITNMNIKEYYIDYKTIKPIAKELTLSWTLHPRLMAYDFEVFGNKGAGRFVNMNAIKDCIFMISIDFKLLELPDSRLKYCLTYGKVDPIEGAIIINFDSEKELLVAFSAITNYLDGDFNFGYNIYKFDEPYLLGRYDILGIPEPNIPSMSRLKNQPTTVYENKWKSSGRGANIITFVNREGRAVADILPLLKSIEKLRMYSLNFVSKQFLGAEKHPVTVQEMFDAFENYQECKNSGNEAAIQKAIDELTRVARYCIQDSTLTIDIFEKLLIWYHVRSLSGEGGVTMPQIYLNGEQCRCYSQLFIECINNKCILSNSKFFDYYYSGGFVGSPIPGVYEFVFTTDFSSLYPSIIRAYNLCWRTYIPISRWPQIPIDKCEVIKPFQEEPVEHFSASRKRDILDKIKLLEGGYHVDITDEEYEYINKDKIIYSNFLDPENPDEEIGENDPLLIDENDKKVIRHYEFRYIKKQYQEGFLPRLETEWVKARNVVKKNMKSIESVLKSLKTEKELYMNNSVADIDSLINESDKITEIGNEKVDKLESIEDEYDKIQEKIDEFKKSHNQNEDSYDEIIESLKQELQYYILEDEKNKLNEEIDDLNERYSKIEKELTIRNDDNLLKQKLKEIDKEIDNKLTQYKSADKQQNSIKIIANSGYGFTGVREGMLSGVFIALCVTFLGRQLIQKANEILVKNFAHLGAAVVYNDTDSSMISLDLKREDVLSGKVRLDKIGKEMEQVISGRDEIRDEFGNITQTYIEPVFKDPLKMEFEDCSQMCPIKPKYYLKAIRNTKYEDIVNFGEFKLEKGEVKIKKKGVLSAKRGNSTYSMELYIDLSDKVLFKKPMNDALKVLVSQVCKLLTDGFEAKDLSKVTELGSEYKQENYFMNVFGNNLIKWGKQVRAGDRLEYIIVKTWNEINNNVVEKIGTKCRDLEMWLDDENREPIDYEYYIEKGIQTQYDDLFNVGYNKITGHELFKDIGYKPKFGKNGKNSQKHFIHFSSPIKMITGIVSDYMNASHEQFKEYFESNYDYEYDPDIARNFYVAHIIEDDIIRIMNYIDRHIHLI